MTKLVLIDPTRKQYTAYNGREKVLKVQSDILLYPEEVEAFRLNPHADEDLFEGNDPDGDLVA